MNWRTTSYWGRRGEEFPHLCNGSSFTSTFSVPDEKNDIIKSLEDTTNPEEEPERACCPSFNSINKVVGFFFVPGFDFTITFVVDSSERAPLVELQCRGGAHGEAGGYGQTRGGQARGDVAAGEELVRLQLGDGGPLGRVGVQHSLDEGGRRRVDVLGGEGGAMASLG